MRNLVPLYRLTAIDPKTGIQKIVKSMAPLFACNTAIDALVGEGYKLDSFDIKQVGTVPHTYNLAAFN